MYIHKKTIGAMHTSEEEGDVPTSKPVGGSSSMTAEIARCVRAAMMARAAEWGVRLLFVAEGGSRATGLGHPASDLDVRFIYARPLRHGHMSPSPLSTS